MSRPAGALRPASRVGGAGSLAARAGSRPADAAGSSPPASRRSAVRRPACAGTRVFRRPAAWWPTWSAIVSALRAHDRALARARCSSPGPAIAAVPILIVCAKLTGLYDRDETLLRKTTLDEAPKLFQLATLCAARRMADGRPARPAARSTATRRCSCGSALAALLVLCRAVARIMALRVSPVGALPVHRRRGVRRDDPLQADRPRRRERQGRRPPGPRQGRALVDGLLLRAAPGGDPRPRPDAGRAPRDHRSAQRRRRRDAQPGAGR